MNRDHETTLLAKTAEALATLGLEITTPGPLHARGPGDPDAWLTIGWHQARAEYAVEIKRRVTATTLGAVVAQLRDHTRAFGAPMLLVTDHLTPAVAERLRAEGVYFADTAGNAYLEAPGLLVYVTGRKACRDQQLARTGQGFTNNGLKVLFALLCLPELADAPQRTIAAVAGIALGAVPAILTDLQQTGRLIVLGKRRKLNATKRLLDEWALAYAHRLRHKTLLATYTTPAFDTWRDWNLNPEEARWGGEPAANLLTGYLRPGVLTLYAEKLPPKLIIERQLTLARTGPAQRYVELRRPFWGKALTAAERPDIVPTPLVYADLLATGDGRCIETAQTLYENHLARLLPAG